MNVPQTVKAPADSQLRHRESDSSCSWMVSSGTSWLFQQLWLPASLSHCRNVMSPYIPQHTVQTMGDCLYVRPWQVKLHNIVFKCLMLKLTVSTVPHSGVLDCFDSGLILVKPLYQPNKYTLHPCCHVKKHSSNNLYGKGKKNRVKGTAVCIQQQP